MLHAVNVSTFLCTVTQLHKGKINALQNREMRVPNATSRLGTGGAAAGPETRLLSLAVFILKLTASTSSIHTQH